MNEKSAFIKKPKEQASLFPPVRTQPEYIIYEASPDTKDTGGVTFGLEVPGRVRKELILFV